MSQTPGRVTRSNASREPTPARSEAVPRARKPRGSRQDSLPPVSVGTSSGYGSRGTAQIKSQLFSGKTNLTSVLQTAGPAANMASRPDPIEEESMDHATEAPRTVGAAGTTRDTTGVDVGLGYQPAQQAGASATIPAVRQPGNLEVTARTVPRYIPAAAVSWRHELVALIKILFYIAFGLAAVLVLLGGTIAMLYFSATILSSSKFWAPLGERLYYQMNLRLGEPPYSVPPSELERMWILFRSQYEHRQMLGDLDFDNNKTRLDLLQSALIDSQRLRLDNLEKRLNMHTTSVKRLEELLPSQLAVTIVDGQASIPEEFWSALESKLNDDSAGVRVWDAFLRRNQANIEVISRSSALQAIDAAAESGRVVTAAQFADAVAKNHEWMMRNREEDMRRAEDYIRGQIHDIATNATTDLITRSGALFSDKELEILAKANLVRNRYEALRSINYLSPGLGALVDPYLTSPTFVKGKTWLARRLYQAHPPVAALQRWDEATECWCAASSDDMGKAQITVRMEHQIHPKDLIIEHIPATGTLNISSAPRHIDLWAQMPKTFVGDISDLQERLYDFRGQTVKCQDPAPTNRHICIGSGSYAIHSSTHVQTVSAMAPMDEFGIAVDTITVRAVSNWGGEATCFYRLRMTGDRILP